MKKVLNSCLSVLVAVIEPALMDDPCDWDVCAEAATPVTLSKLSSGAERRRHAKSAADPTAKSSGHRKLEKTAPAPSADARGEEVRRSVGTVREDGAQGRQRAGPTTAELQEALPKIPPLSSFKRCRPAFVTLEEAELDFYSFITTGLGRSVDVLREFRGQEDGDPSEHSESITLDDDSSECLKLCRKWSKSHLMEKKPTNCSSSPLSSRDDGESAPTSESQPEARQVAAEPEPKAEPRHIEAEAPAPQKAPSKRETSPPRNYDPSRVKGNRRDNPTGTRRGSRDESKARDKYGERKKKASDRGNREHKGRDSEDRGEEEEEEWSAEAYWRASYRAWRDYYASMAAFQSQGYQSCYGAAPSWMAAYRMNAVYMEELLKD